MRIKKKNVARLASLSALGAGALGVAAGTAEAGVVYIGLSSKVGFSSGYGSYFGLDLLSTGSATINVIRSGSGRSPGVYYRNVRLWGSSVGFKPEFAAFGQTWNNLPGATVSRMRLGSLRAPAKLTSYSGTTFWVQNGAFSVAGGPNGNFYALFTFTPNTTPLYGWVYLHQTVSLANNGTGPDVDILGIAYDDQGNQIAAGTGVPEPSTMALTGLAALALGAAGLRRWRAARNPAA